MVWYGMVWCGGGTRCGAVGWAAGRARGSVGVATVSRAPKKAHASPKTSSVLAKLSETTASHDMVLVHT